MCTRQIIRKRLPRWRPLAATATLALAACASPPPASWPATLEPGASEAWLMTLNARGVQIYECRGNAAAAAWVFVAPEAELFDDTRRRVGSHGAGPLWQAADGSRVEGTLTARADAPTADAIPWLLLTTRSTGPSGLFRAVTGVRRVHTVGGTPPRWGCGADTLGAVARVPYAADYYFYSAR